VVDISGRASDEKEVILVEKKGKREQKSEKETKKQNKSLRESEPTPEAVVGANESVGESVGEGGSEINGSQEGGERKMPVNVWDLLIALIAAISISIAVKRKRY